MFSVVFGIYHALRKLIPKERREGNSSDREEKDSENSPRDNLNENTNSSVEPTKEIVEEIVTQVKDVDLHSQQSVQAEGSGNTKHVEEDFLVKVKDVGLYSKQKVEAEGYSAAVECVNKVDDLAGTFEHKLHGFEDCPYISDPSTIEFIRNSTTMFLMRGLPGSGKSTIVRYLKKLYPQSAVCSADDFFLGKDGEYRFDQSKLTEAHAECQNKATVLCEKNTPVIIIDNTNIQRWEMGFYFRLANSQHYYHTFIVEPQTPWRHNVNELAKRNKHGVGIDILHKKLDQLKGKRLFPLYYGWFFTKSGSSRIVKISKEVLSTCVTDLKLSADKKSTYILKGILEDFDIYYTDPKGMLHCTSCFVGSKGDHPFHHSKYVQGSIGKVFKLNITGFSYTPRSLSARINLNCSRNGKLPSDVAATDLYERPEEESLRERFKGQSKANRALHYLQHGCSAHVTLKVSNDLQPKVTGEDILTMCELGFRGKERVMELSHGLLHCYQDNMFYLQLKEPLILDTLFHGYHSPGRR